MPFLSVSLWTECTQIVGTSQRLTLIGQLDSAPASVSMETVGGSLYRSVRQPEVLPAVASKLLARSGPVGMTGPSQHSTLTHNRRHF